MADPMDTTRPKTDATVSDPQAMVDAALGNVSASTTPTPATDPAPAPVVAESQSQVAELPPLSPTPTPASLPEMPKPMASTNPQPTPSTIPTPTMGSVPMGDDTPLAFATPPSSTMETNNSSTVTAPSSLGTSVPMDSIPPAPLAPMESVKPKKKSKMGFVIGGILLLVLGIGGGLWGYNTYSFKKAEVALVTGCSKKGSDVDIEACYLGTAAVLDKKPELVKTQGQQIVKAINAGKGAEEIEKVVEDVRAIVENDPAYQKIVQQTTLQLNNDEKIVAQNAAAAKKKELADKCDTLFSQLQSGDPAAKTDPLNPCKNGSCTLTPDMVEAKCIIQRVTCKDGGKTGVACEETIASTVNTAGQPVSVDNTATCGSEQVDVICKELCGDTQPLSFANRITGKSCAGAKTTTTKTTTTTENPTHKVCNTTTFQCQTVDGAGTDTCTTDANCVVTAPTMACTSLTSAPSVSTTAPTIGQKVTFTCLGAVTPTTAGTLTYKFRYSLNSGAVTALTNKTPTTAELTISACGSYKVECQACTTLNGVAKCDPIWTGATQ